MKVTLQQIKDGKEEVIVKYKQMTERIEGIVRYVEGQSEKLLGIKDGQECMLCIHNIIYNCRFNILSYPCNILNEIFRI